MSISYHGIVGNKAKATLPSAEGWKSTNGVLRDPPKSITTRRIDKVDADGSMNLLYANSDDRFAENITVFARGVNPMVSVQYTDKAGNGKQPYRIMNGGAFRPPQLSLEQLLPLSRQRRLVTFVDSKKAFIDYTKSLSCDAHKSPEHFRQIKKEDMTLEGSTFSNKSAKVAKVVTEHYTPNFINENNINTSATTNKTTKGNINLTNKEKLREAMKQLNQYTSVANVSAQGESMIRGDMGELNKNLPTYEMITNKSSYMKTTLPENEIVLTRTLPEYNVQSKKSENIQFVQNQYTTEDYINRNKELYSIASKITGKAGNMIQNIENNKETNKTINQYATHSNITGTPKRVYVNEDIQLNRNVPEYNVMSRKTRNGLTSIISAENDIELDRNLPEYNITSSKTDNRHVYFSPEHERELYSKVASSSSAHTNMNMIGEVSVNRDVRLPPSIHAGGFENHGNIPSLERHGERNMNYTNGKRAIANYIMNERE